MYILDNFDDNLKNILDNGYDMIDRTDVGCRYLPGVVTKIDISERVPVPTRRKTAWKSMLKEYLWFLTGSDKIGDLENTGSKVWNAWKDKEWAKERNLPEDSIGYGYGPNLINYGDELNGKKGFNQVNHVIDLLKSNPNSRRILWSFFRPDKQGKDNVVLDPCHLIYQFIPTPNENGTKDLNCVVYIRSNDMAVGAMSTNLQGASFYTYMIAQQVNMNPKELTVVSAHAHIYSNHFEGLNEYLNRPKPNSPILKLNKKNSIYDYTADDFELYDYNPLPKIKFPLAV